MNLLKVIFLLITIFFAFIENGCLKSNCTDQVKKPELFGIWYYYHIENTYGYCDSTNRKGKTYSYYCDKIRLQRVQYQFSNERFIEEEHCDTITDTSKVSLIDTEIIEINKYWFFTWGYNFYSLGEFDWFTDRSNLIICNNNSLCFENECNVYTWKIENEKLFLQNDQATYVLTREDLFEKIRNSVKADSSK